MGEIQRAEVIPQADHQIQRVIAGDTGGVKSAPLLFIEWHSFGPEYLQVH